jgi:DNA polymerase-3 subunit alpha
MGGIVTAIRKGISKKGQPFGIVTIEDYEGSGELPLFGRDWATWSNYMEVGYTLFIQGNIQPRQYKPDQLEFHINSVDFLTNAQEKLVRKLTLSFYIEQLDEEAVFGLADYAKNNPGKSRIVFDIYEVGRDAPLQTIANKYRINITKSLLDYLDGIPSFTYQIN